LNRAAEDPGLALGGELLRAFRTTVGSTRAGKRRTVAELRAGAGVQREKAEAARSKKAKAAAEAARHRHLAKLARDVALSSSFAWTGPRPPRARDVTLPAFDGNVAATSASSASEAAKLRVKRPRFLRAFSACCAGAQRWLYTAISLGFERPLVA